MAISAKFRVEEHREHGIVGLKMLGRHWADPLGAMATAHDLLEHFPNDNGSVEHELMALGASLYVRDGSTVYHRLGQYRCDPAENIAADMVQQCYYLLEAGRDALRPAHNRRLRHSWIEDIIQRTWEESHRLVRGEFGDDNQRVTRWLDDRQSFTGYLRMGYRRACHRYRGIPSWKMAQCFMNVHKEVEQFLKHYEECLGMEVQITVRPRRESVVLTFDEGEE